MSDSGKNPSAYSPVHLTEDEKIPSDGTQSIHEPAVARDVKLDPDSYFAYETALDKLRLITPQRHELKTRLGDRCFVLQFRSKFSLNSVPDEFRRKESPLLWRVSFDDVLGYVTDTDLKTFYFGSEQMAADFLSKLTGEAPGIAVRDLVEKRHNLRNLLW